MSTAPSSLHQGYSEGQTLDLFAARLPRSPYHTDDPESGLRIAYREQAILSRYIQPNPPSQCCWLIYDVDHPHAGLDWHDRHAPPPTLVARNPVNGHAHLFYGLADPVTTSTDARSEPLRYLAAVDCALREKLAADFGYSGLIAKNPLRTDAWLVKEWESQLYTLDELDSWLDLSAYKDRRKRMPEYGLGRNCNLFENLRRWAYRAIRQGWPDPDRWFEAVLTRAEAYNNSHYRGTDAGPLNHSEVKAIAKSVAKFTSKHFSPEGYQRWRTEQGRRGGKSKGKAVRESLMPRALEMVASGMSQRAVARELGIDHKTVGNWIKRG
ncbi:replication initiation protein [Cobetia marina]|uniref:replication initiation protein n=1 Tax=Cobetia marina TaxID=28258 RepID=UPI0026E3BC99|nr:replication initiation protein [Cobetia marina]MDO6789254.1 replication initiation protein [Cobetia marina]